MSKTRLMAFRFWVDDWEGGTSLMTNEEAGAYLRLLIYQFRNERIPELIFKRICGSEFIESLLKEKFTYEDGFYINHRMTQTRIDTIEFSKKQSQKGKKSAESKKGKSTTVATTVDESVNHGSTTEQPLGSGSGIGSNEDKDNKGGVGEKEGEGEIVLKSDSEKYYQQSICDEQWLIALYRSTKVEFNELPKYVLDFHNDVTAREEYHETLSRWRSHCVSWIKKEKKNATKSTKSSRKPASLEEIDAWGRAALIKIV